MKANKAVTARCGPQVSLPVCWCRKSCAVLCSTCLVDGTGKRQSTITSVSSAVMIAHCKPSFAACTARWIRQVSASSCMHCSSTTLSVIYCQLAADFLISRIQYLAMQHLSASWEFPLFHEKLMRLVLLDRLFLNPVLVFKVLRLSLKPG